MPRAKLRRFALLERMENVVDGRRDHPGWFDAAVGAESTIAVELGCGRGEYTLALARSRPDQGVLGVDRNGARLWKGAERALADGLTNARFFRGPAEALADHVPAGRVHEIWLPFPDPLPKARHAPRRLVSPEFCRLYRRLLAPGGAIHLRTDDADLVTYAERSVRSVGGRVADEPATPAPDDPMRSVETTYEARYREEGRTILERVFRFEDVPAGATVIARA